MTTLASLCRKVGGDRDRDVAARNGRRAQVLVWLLFSGAFAGLTAKVIQYAVYSGEMPMLAVASGPPMLAKSRPDIVDRNGRLLATDIRVYWLAANPKQIPQADEAAEKLAALFSDLDEAVLAQKFRNKASHFEWVKRGLTPKQADAAHALGIPGLTILPTVQRVYPAGNEAAHILGVTNIDNDGMSGIEHFIDQKLLLQLTPASLSDRPIVKLALDLGVQHVLTEELSEAMTRYQAKAALGLVLDVDTGEVLASASLPDFDPNRREQSAEENRQNRVVTDLYELGSVFKSFTIAMALDQGVAGRFDLFDSSPLPVGHTLLRDPHAKRDYLTVEDIFIHSSNTGTARIAMAAGMERQQAFLKSAGLFERIETEAGISPKPEFPKIWRPANAITIAYGHGIAVPPLLFASAFASLINGGTCIEPTFLLSEKGAGETGSRIIQPATSMTMRDLMRLVVEKGTGRRAAVPGLDIGGKTGTAIKLKDGHYGHEVINSFVAAFPISAPRYLVMVTLDEPKPEEPGKLNEAGYNAAPTAGAILKRIAPMLRIAPEPRFDGGQVSSYEQADLTARDGVPSRKYSHAIHGSDQGNSALGQSERPLEPRYYGAYGR